MSTEKKELTANQTLAFVAMIIGTIIILFVVLRPDEGKEGGDCFKDGSCYAGLGCKSQKCVKIDDGKEGGECLPNGNCMGKLTCNKLGFCEGKTVASGAGRPCTWKNGYCRW